MLLIGLARDALAMARLPRLELAGVAQHVVQRGRKKNGVRFTYRNRVRFTYPTPQQARIRCRWRQIPLLLIGLARDALAMARLPRLELAGVAQHVVQRGNNRLPCFLDDADRRCYLHFLREGLLASGCDLHAYVLMNNHVHMLMTPPEVGAVARLMQMLGRSYVGAFNARHRRTGTLWEGRYKSCLVDAQEYLLNCYRYIELNPVRARMVEDPEHHQWSSYAFNGTCRPDPLLTPHPCYDALGADHPSRAAAYQVIVRQALPDETVEEIRTYLQQQRALGRDDFRSMVEARTQRFAGTRPAHRPANSSALARK